MDYTQVLNDINSKLGTIISILQAFNTDDLLNYVIILFAIFLLFYIMRGE